MPDEATENILQNVIEKVATELKEELRLKSLPGALIPEIALLKRSIELLGNLNVLDVQNMGFDFTPRNVIRELKKLLRTPEDPNPELTPTLLETLFKGECLAAPYGTSTRPSNRPTIPMTANGTSPDFLYKVDEASFPSLPGITTKNINDAIDAAWVRWIDATPTKLRSRRWEEGSGTPNLLIQFGNIDGSGRSLGVTRTQWRSDGPSNYTILIDTQESWTKAKLFTTLIHEIGHALGLEHTSDPKSIMAATFPAHLEAAALSKVQLTAADKAALAASRWA